MIYVRVCMREREGRGVNLFVVGLLRRTSIWYRVNLGAEAGDEVSVSPSRAVARGGEDGVRTPSELQQSFR